MLKALIKQRDMELVLKADRDGIIGQAPKIEDVGRLFEGARDQQTQAIFTIHETGKVRVCMPLVTEDYHRLARDYYKLQQDNRDLHENEELWINLRVHGLGKTTWRGSIERLEDSEVKNIPIMLSNRGGGPVAVQPPTSKTPGLVPQTQHYLVYITIDNPDQAIMVGAMSQVKIYLQPETCLHWAWRSINDLFNLRLI
jgi:hypothetical protein